MRTRRSPRNQARLWKALGQQGAQPTEPPPEAYVRVPGERLYEAIVRLGIPHANHESDLYVPATAQVCAILRAYGIKPHGHAAPAFRNRVEGGIWFDLPFQYLPWWEARQR